MERRERFPAGFPSAGQARSFVREVLEGWELDGFLDDALLVVTELVVNATLHADSPTEVSVRRTGDGVRISVRDESRELPIRRDYGLEASTGRGLRILDALAPGWVAMADGHGKVVVAELRGAGVGSEGGSSDG